MSGKKEKARRKALGIDLKDERGRAQELKEMHQRERQAEYERGRSPESRASARALVTIAAMLGSR